MKNTLQWLIIFILIIGTGVAYFMQNVLPSKPNTGLIEKTREKAFFLVLDEDVLLDLKEIKTYEYVPGVKEENLGRQKLFETNKDYFGF